MKIIIGIRSHQEDIESDVFEIQKKNGDESEIVRRKILSKIKTYPFANEQGSEIPTYDFLISEDSDKEIVMSSMELSGEIIGVIDEKTLLDFKKNKEGDITIDRINPTNEEALPQQHTVDQLKKVQKTMDKEIGGGIDSKISDMNKQGANIQFIRNPIKTGIESYQDFEKSNRKIFKFKEFQKKSKKK